jgi:hypothetical protein
MGSFKKTAFVFSICCIIAGCGDYDSENSSSRGRHYSDLVREYGEPREVVSDGTGGKIYSWSPLPVDDALKNESRSLSHDVYRVNSQGYVYDRP